MNAPETQHSVVVYGSIASAGGLGHSCASAITAVAQNKAARITAIGPGYQMPWAFPGGLPNLDWVKYSYTIPPWKRRFTWYRWRPGILVEKQHIAHARWAARELVNVRPTRAYLLTETALDSLRFLKNEGIPTVLDNPNGHIRNFRAIYEREFQRWCAGKYYGHPTEAMVERVCEEYELADRIRVCGQWGVDSMTRFGIDSAKVHSIPQPVNLEKFQPPASRRSPQGPLRICFVGTFDLRKGFVYLLQAIRKVGPKWIELEMVGSTTDRHTARLFETERKGLNVKWGPGNPIPVYQSAEVFVCPTLEDGVPFVLLEAMACGLPIIASEEAGATEAIRQNVHGWRVPAADAEAIASALEDALRRRDDLPEMSRLVRARAEEYAGPHRLKELAEWFYETSL